jgi:hypothetical protein
MLPDKIPLCSIKDIERDANLKKNNIRFGLLKHKGINAEAEVILL